MLVVISDLHFEEEKSRNIKGNGQHESIEVPRNISFKAFSKIFMRLAEQADRDGAHKIDLVLAGDIFELHRTALWFQNNPQNVRPYVATDEVEVEILHAINSDGSEVAKVFAAIRQLAEGGVKYRAENGKEKEFKYERSLEFDDLRPMQALLNYLLYRPTSGFSPDKIWEQALQPVIIQLLEDLHDHPFLHYWLDQLDKKGAPDMVDAIQVILKLQPWNFIDLSLKQIQRVSNLALKKHQASAGPQAIAAREETIQNGEHLYIVGGHTHTPAVELIGQRPGSQGTVPLRPFAVQVLQSA